MTPKGWLARSDHNSEHLFTMDAGQELTSSPPLAEGKDVEKPSILLPMNHSFQIFLEVWRVAPTLDIQFVNFGLATANPLDFRLRGTSQK